MKQAKHAMALRCPIWIICVSKEHTVPKAFVSNKENFKSKTVVYSGCFEEMKLTFYFWYSAESTHPYSLIWVCRWVLPFCWEGTAERFDTLSKGKQSHASRVLSLKLLNSSLEWRSRAYCFLKDWNQYEKLSLPIKAEPGGMKDEWEPEHPCTPVPSMVPLSAMMNTGTEVVVPGAAGFQLAVGQHLHP